MNVAPQPPSHLAKTLCGHLSSPERARLLFIYHLALDAHRACMARNVAAFMAAGFFLMGASVRDEIILWNVAKMLAWTACAGAICVGYRAYGLHHAGANYLAYLASLRRQYSWVD